MEKKYLKILYNKEYNIELDNYNDSALLYMIMNDERVLAGGSGPSCLPSYFYSKIIPDMKMKKLKRVLLLATGALLNTTSVNQKKLYHVYVMQLVWRLYDIYIFVFIFRNSLFNRRNINDSF